MIMGTYAQTKAASLTILRYPGGKRWFIPLAEKFVQLKRPKIFVEPFAGGATVALTLLWRDLVDEIVLVELDDRVATFWRRVLDDPDFPRLVHDFMPNGRDKARLKVEEFMVNPTKDLALWVLVQNRCGFGGMLDSGLLRKGSKDKQGHYEGVLSRWNREELAKILHCIRAMRGRIHFVHGDGIQEGLLAFDHPDNAAFIDPPYLEASKDLYKHHGAEGSGFDHKLLFDTLAKWKGRWAATYDNDPRAVALADERGLIHSLVNMRARTHAAKQELLISPDLLVWS
jgi:DNA adenine methylase